MRERRAAHVRPRPPSSDRLPTQAIRASAPPLDAMRRYRPLRTGPRVQGPTAVVIVSACIIFGLLTLSVGTGLMADLIGGIAGAFGNSINRMASRAPATAPPSGVSLDTPVLDAPPHNGYTNQASVVIQGSVPSATVGKTGYAVHVFLLDKNGPQRQVASVTVGGTTRFITPAITLTEGSNVFVASLVSPSGEGGPSPAVTYILDTAPPKITIISPAQGIKVTTSSIDVSGTCDAGATVGIRNQQVPGGGYSSQVVGSDGRFKLTMRVVAGQNTIDVMATDQAGNSSSSSLTVKRDYGKLAAHLAATPSKFASKSQTTLQLTVHATSFNGGPLANAKVTFTVAIQGLGPIVSPELTTDATGIATWQVAISGASAGTGQAGVLVTSPDGDQVTETASITTT
jgi:hypothetical protein